MRCPFGRPAVTEQCALRRRRRAVPDDVLRDVPRTWSPRSPGSRRREASSAGARRSQHEPELAASLERATRSSAASAASCGGPNRHATAARRSSWGSAARANPEQLKCLHAHVGLRARAAGLRARRADPRRGRSRSGRASAAWTAQTRPYDRTAMSAVAVENARREWEDGYRRLNETRRDRPLHERLLARGRRRHRRAAPPGRADLHARRAGGRVRRTPTGGPGAWPSPDAPGWPQTLGTRRGRGVPPLLPRRRRLRAMSRLPAERVAGGVGRAGCCARVGARVVFAIGIALGEALDDSSERRRARRRPSARSSPARCRPTVTVTVTVTQSE